ncbi:TPA: hypothetical protein ACH3X1_004414 [Trebouxia sp. C0004]
MLPSPDHDRQSSSTDTGPAMQHHVSGHAQVLQHSQVGDHRHHQLAERPDHAHDADHRSLLNMAASGQLFTASNTVWQGSRKASEEAIRPPARRYQRCLQEELGQLLNSQLSNGQPGRQLSGQAGHPDRQLQRLDGQHTPISGQAAHPHEGPQPGHAQRSTAASWQQADQAFATQLSNPVQPPHSLQHTAADSVTGNREPCSQAASDSAYLTKLGSRHAGAQLTDPKPQAYGSQHRRQLKSSEIFSQPKAMLQSQSEAKSVQSNASVHQASSQDCIISAAGQTAVKPTQLCHQQPGGRPETVTHHAKETKADFDGLRGNTEGQVAAVSRRRASGIRLDEDLIQLKRVFPGSRGSSPRRRHLLLHNRLAPFDSNSSSSEDEEPSTPVARPLDSPLPTLSGQKSHLGGEASDSAAPQMSQASDESQAAGGDCPAIGQSAVSHAQQQAILAAAKAASDRQLVELQMHVLMLESEKTELSTQLSAAQRCMPTTESTASVADADKIDIPPPNQKLNQVAKMLERLAASDDKSKQLQRQLSELQSSARHKHEQLLVFTDKAQQLQEQLRAADDNAKRLLEQLGLAQARAAAAQLSGSALASDLASAHTAVALKLERLVQAQSQIAQLQQQLQAAQDAAQQSKLSLKFELDSTRTQHAATQHELAYVQQQLQAARHQAQTHMQTEADLKKSLGAAECSAADKGGKLAQSNAEIAALVSQLQDDHREACQAREDARQCESGLRAELLSVHTQLANHQSRANSWQQQAQDTDQRAEQAELQLVVQSQAMAELQKQLLTAQDTQQQAEDVRHEVVQAQAELVTKQASLVKAEAAAEALQQSLQDTQQAAAQTHDSAQQSESALRAELQAAHAQQAAAQVGIMQARGQITVLQERLDITSQKLTKQLVSNRETESALQAEVASMQCQFGSSQSSLEKAQQEALSLQQRLQLSEQQVTGAEVETAAASQALVRAQKQLQETQLGSVQARAELAAKQESLLRAEAAVAAAEQAAAQAHDSAEQRQAALRSELQAAHAQQAAALVRTMQARGQVTVLQERLDDANQKLSQQLVTSQQAESALRAEATAAQQEQAAMHEHHSVLQGQVQTARQNLSKQEQAAHQVESSLKLELESAQLAESDLAVRLQASQQQQLTASAEVTALQQQLQTARGDLTEQTTRVQQAEADLQREPSAFKQTQVHLSSELLSAQQAESHLQAELDTVQQHQAASQGQVPALQQQLDSLQKTLVSHQSLAQQSAADLDAQQLAAQLIESQLRAELTASQEKQTGMRARITQLQQQLQSMKESLVTQQKLARQSQSDLGVELLIAQQTKSQLRSELATAQQQQTQVENQLTALLQQLQSAQEEVSLQLRLAQEAEYVSQAASQHAEAELQLSAKSSKHLQVQVEQLEQQLHHAIGSSQHLEQHVSQLQQQLQVARADAAELQQHDDVHQAQLYATRSTIAQLQAKFIDTQAQLAAADAQTDELQAQLATIQLRCSESQRQLANAVEQTAASGETHAQLVAEAAQSRQQLANISAQLAASRLRCSDLESGMTLHQMAAGESSVAPAAPVFSHHCSRRSSSTDQQAGGQEEEEEGAVGAIVDKLWKDLQIERAARQLAEERLQAVEAAAISHQESLLSMHSDSALLYQEVDQFKSVTQLRDDLSAEALAVELRQSLTESKLEPAVTQGSLPAQQPAEVMPHGSTLQRTNPLFSQQEGTGSEALLMQMPVTVHDSGGADMTHQVMPAQAANPCQSAASETSDEDSDPSAAELADSAQNSDPKAAELADPAQNSASSASTEQQQEQVDALHSQLRAKASELQTAEAATEYVQQLLNAVSAENRDLRKQLDQKRILKRSVSELQRSSSSLAFANIQGLSAEHVSKGVALGLQPGRSQISAMWASSPSVRRSLLPEYGSSEPYVRPEQALEGAESLMGLPGSDSMLAEFHSDSMSGLSWPQQSDSGHIESLSQIALKRLSQQGAESSSPSVSGIQQIHTRTPASRGGTPETALMRIGSMDPSSGAFGAALAAAERTSITPKHKISRNISQEEGSVWSGVSPSKASWTTLLKWGSRQLPFGKRESDPEIQPDQVILAHLVPVPVCLYPCLLCH